MAALFTFPRGAQINSPASSRYLTQGVQEPRGRLHPRQLDSPWRILQ